MSELTHEEIMKTIYAGKILSDGYSKDRLSNRLSEVYNMLTWRPIDELPDEPPDGMWIELAGHYFRRFMQSCDGGMWRNQSVWVSRGLLIRQGTYTHWRFVLPGPEES